VGEEELTIESVIIDDWKLTRDTSAQSSMNQSSMKQSTDQSSTDQSTRRERLIEVALLFTRLGFTAFGGPAAHVAMMEQEVVVRRKWIDRQHFLDLVAAVNFIPGPNSTELAIHLGLIRAGYAGLVTAGLCFIVPAVIIILPLAYLYVSTGALPQVSAAMHGINACVIAIIIAAALRFAHTAVRDRFTVFIGLLALAIGLFGSRFPQIQPELLALALSATLGAIYYARPKIPPPAVAALLPLFATTDLSRNLAKMSLFFLKAGATLFGSGYVLVSYLQSGLVDQHGWLTRQQLLDAIAIGQVTPGPLLTTATFIGYVLGAQRFGGGVAGGLSGAMLATAAIFAPSFVLIALLAPVLRRIRQHPLARGALDGMNAAVVALIFVVSVRLAGPALFAGGRLNVINVLIACASLLAILRWNVNSTWLILAAALIGIAFGTV
jgi:chromate transporter